MKSKYAKRLLKLSAFLDELPAEHFNFGQWISECGTTACALGWATTMPTFRRLGLRMDRDIHGYRVPCIGSDTESSFDRGYSWHRATREIFGLDEAESELLFVPSNHRVPAGTFPGDLMPNRYANAKHVAEQIRAFIAWRWPA